jgi:hypothetical protein
MALLKRSRNMVWALALMAVGVLSIVPAQADGPLEFDTHVDRQGVFESCGTFNVNLVAHIDAHFEQFFDASGQLALERRHVQFTGTLTNAITGASVPYEGNYIRTLDVPAGTVSLIGLRRETAVDGQVLAMAAGSLLINTRTGATISESGRTDESYNAAICALLT